MNYEAAERAMNQKRLRMEGEPGHGVVQGNGLPLNYIDNGHQIAYQPYAGAYNTHYHPPDAFAAYGPPPPGGYAPQNLSYAPPAHQNYPHHQSFQQPQQLHMQSHMGLPSLAVQGYGDVHKSWAPQPHLLPPLDAVKPLDIKQLKPEIKVEPTDVMKRPMQDEIMGGDLDQPKIKIKTDIFKPDDVMPRPEAEKPHDVTQIAAEVHKPDSQNKAEAQPSLENKTGEKPAEVSKPEGAATNADAPRPADSATPDKSQEDRKPFSSPDMSKQGTPKPSQDDLSPKKRGRPKGSTNKPRLPPPTPTPRMPGAVAGVRPTVPRPTAPPHRPRAQQPYQYSVRQFRKDFSGIQFRRRWSDDCLDSSHIPNEVYFGDVPVSMEVLFNYYDANAERERLAAQAAHIAAQKAAAAKLAAAKLQARGLIPPEIRGKVTQVDSSSSDESDSDDSDSNDSDDDEAPAKKTKSPKVKSGSGKRGRPPVPPELREPGITDMKRFCKAAGINFDYKKLTDGCTKNKERVGKMMDLLIAAGLEGKPTMEKCKALKAAKQQKREQAKQAKKEAKVKQEKDQEEETETPASRRMTRGATGVKPRQRIVISSDEEDDTPAARRTLSKLRSSVNDDESD